MPDDARAKLADDQTRLVAALSRRADPPPGFDPARIDLSARTLLAKRRKGVRRAFPALAASLAEAFNGHFAAFARTSPPDPAGPGADGFAFAQWLDARGLIPTQAVHEFIVARLRRGRRVGFSIRGGAGRWVVGLRLPGLGVRLLRLPGWRSARFPSDGVRRFGKMRPTGDTEDYHMAMICPACGAKNLEGVDECKSCGSDLRMVDLPRPASEVEQSVMHLPLTTLSMTTVHAVAPDAPLDTAVQTLVRQKLDLLEVVEDGKLIGVLSIRDVLTRVGPGYRDKLARPVREFMTAKVETLPPDAPITFALNRMDVGGFRHVPVVQDGRVLGVVSSRDVLTYIVKHSREHVATEGVTTSHGVRK